MSRRFRTLRGSDGSPLSLLGIAACLVLLGTIIWAAAYAIPLLLTRAPRPAAGADATTSTDPVAPLKSDQQIKQYIAQIDGRSLFFIPPAPSAEVSKNHPATYTGPTLLAMINDSAWFSDGDRVSLQSPQGKDIRLLRLNPPWGARVLWEGGEFDVELFKRVPLSSLRDTLTKPAPAAKDSLGYSPHPPSAAAAADTGPNGWANPLPPGTKAANPSKSNMPAPPAPPAAEGAEADTEEASADEPAANSPPALPPPGAPAPGGTPGGTGGPRPGNPPPSTSPKAPGTPAPAPTPVPANPKPSN